MGEGCEVSNQDAIRAAQFERDRTLISAREVDSLAVANPVERHAMGEVLAHPIRPSARAESLAFLSRCHQSRVASTPVRSRG